jgi:hypothetical protein
MEKRGFKQVANWEKEIYNFKINLRETGCEDVLL